MKKNYFLAVLFAFAMVTASAQFALDDMESYGGGNAPILMNHWGSWDGTPGTAILSSGNQSQSGALSGLVDGSGIDPLLLLGDKIFGSWGVKFSMYIPTGKIGYWNLQGQEVPGVQWVVGNIYFGNSGIGGDGATDGRIDWSTGDDTDDTTFTFPNDVWFDVTMNFDFNAGAGASTWTMWVHDGATHVEVVAPGTPFADKGTPPVYAQALGGVNIFSISADCEQYFDDVEYIMAFYPDPNTAGIGDLSAYGFSAYPNPVQNVLNLNAQEAISNVSIYNVLGQEVYSANVDALNTTVDMSSFTSGAYFVKVNIAGTEGIVKILK